jgi:hypothetical protein
MNKPHAHNERLKGWMAEENKNSSPWSRNSILSYIRTVEPDGKKKPAKK